MHSPIQHRLRECWPTRCSEGTTYAHRGEMAARARIEDAAHGEGTSRAVPPPAITCDGYGGIQRPMATGNAAHSITAYSDCRDSPRFDEVPHRHS
jgi:hypothetical protein